MSAREAYARNDLVVMRALYNADAGKAKSCNFSGVVSAGKRDALEFYQGRCYDCSSARSNHPYR
jgi:hypothetical protein